MEIKAVSIQEMEEASKKLQEKIKAAKEEAKAEDKLIPKQKAFNWLEANCRFEREHGYEYVFLPEDTERKLITDSVTRTIFKRMIKAGISVSYTDVTIMMQTQAEEQVNKDLAWYIKNVKHDGVPRAISFMVDFFKNKKDKHVEEKVKAFLIQCIRRIMKPGCSAPYMLILAGKGGAGKSLLCKFLGGELDSIANKASAYSEASLDFDNEKSSGEILKGKFIQEVGELKNFGKADMNHLKAFITRNKDRYRPSYGKDAIEQLRTCCLIGTTNETAFLKDLDGLRRYIVIDTTRDIDTSYVNEILAQDFWQFWAEVYTWYEKLTAAELSRGINIDHIIQADAMKYIKFEQNTVDYVDQYMSKNFNTVNSKKFIPSIEITAYLTEHMPKGVLHTELSKYLGFIGFKQERTPYNGIMVNAWKIEEEDWTTYKKMLFVNGKNPDNEAKASIPIEKFDDSDPTSCSDIIIPPGWVDKNKSVNN